MSILIVVSAAPDRQAYRSNDARAAAVLAEKAIWPLLKAGRAVHVLVQASEAGVENALRSYFRELIETEAGVINQPVKLPGARAG